jgi:hypothetical protein
MKIAVNSVGIATKYNGEIARSGVHLPAPRQSVHAPGANLPRWPGAIRALQQVWFRGVVSKRLASRYSSGPSRNWVKTKCPDWKRANANRHKLFEDPKKPPAPTKARVHLLSWLRSSMPLCRTPDARHVDGFLRKIDALTDQSPSFHV